MDRTSLPWGYAGNGRIQSKDGKLVAIVGSATDSQRAHADAKLIVSCVNAIGESPDPARLMERAGVVGIKFFCLLKKIIEDGLVEKLEVDEKTVEWAKEWIEKTDDRQERAMKDWAGVVTSLPPDRMPDRHYTLIKKETMKNIRNEIYGLLEKNNIDPIDGCAVLHTLVERLTKQTGFDPKSYKEVKW